VGSGVSNSVSVSSSSVYGFAVHDDDAYLVGSFNRAGGKPALPLSLLLRNPRWEFGLMAFGISGVSSGTYSVLASTNLVNWETPRASHPADFILPYGVLPKNVHFLTSIV
jgi:hypothetical protein